jgi:ribonuclease E
MKDTKNRISVENMVKACLKEDKARSKTGRISRFGLLELSRQRIRPSIEFGSFTKCPHCKGKGLILSTESLALAFLRKLDLETLKEGITKAKGFVTIDVASYILNKKRAELLDIETKRGITVSVDGHAGMIPGESKIICE